MFDIKMNEQAARHMIVEVGRRLYERGYIAAADGNISVRLEGRRQLLATPTGVCKGFLKPEMLVIVDEEGRKLQGDLNPSSELAMHVTIYRLRPDVHAVVHAHPPVGTGFAASGIPLTKPLVSEVVLTLGCIPLAEYGTPTTEELAQAITPYVPHYDALLLANHGALTYGADLEDAYFKMETLEHFARIALVAHLLGQERPLPPEAVSKLFQIRQRAGRTSPTPSLCQVPTPSGRATEGPANANDRITLTRRQLVDLIAESIEATLAALIDENRSST